MAALVAAALVHRHACRPACAPFCRPAGLPSHRTCLPACLPACLHTFFPHFCPPLQNRRELMEVMRPEEVHLPNGMAWDEAKQVVYYVDSGAESIVEYQADEQVGRKWAGCRGSWLTAVAGQWVLLAPLLKTGMGESILPLPLLLLDGPQALCCLLIIAAGPCLPILPCHCRA